MEGKLKYFTKIIFVVFTHYMSNRFWKIPIIYRDIPLFLSEIIQICLKGIKNGVNKTGGEIGKMENNSTS